MKITYDLLLRYGACEEQQDRFCTEYPAGLEPTVEALIGASAAGYDVMWIVRLLPVEGLGGQRAFVLWCAEQVAHPNSDTRVEQCLDVVRRRVVNPSSVTDEELSVAQSAALAAAGDVTQIVLGVAAGAAAGAAATGEATWDTWEAALTAAWADAGSAAREMQITMLAEMLIQCEELT